MSAILVGWSLLDRVRARRCRAALVYWLSLDNLECNLSGHHLREVSARTVPRDVYDRVDDLGAEPWLLHRSLPPTQTWLWEAARRIMAYFSVRHLPARYPGMLDRHSRRSQILWFATFGLCLTLTSRTFYSALIW